MTSILPINLDDLLRQRGVESVRVELKAAYDDVIAGEALRTICGPVFWRRWLDWSRRRWTSRVRC